MQAGRTVTDREGGLQPRRRSPHLCQRSSRHPPGSVDKIDLAHVIAHELAHTRGMKDERAMRGCALYGRKGNWRDLYAWAEQLPLEKAPPTKKPRPSVDERIAHAQSMLRRALTREKRATTLRKKWQVRLKRLERSHAPEPLSLAAVDAAQP